MKNTLTVALSAMLSLLLLAASPAQAEWRRAESPNFILYGEGSEGRLRERILLLEEFRRLLVAMTSVNAEATSNKLAVYIVSGNNDLRRIGNVSSGVAGFYTSTVYGIAAFVDANVETSAQEVLFHEYVHHFMWQYAPTAYPAWYVEGFAEYFMTTQFRTNEVHVGLGSASRAWSVLDGNWLPMERVLFGTQQGLSREERQRYYSQAWMIVHYFNSDPALQAKLRRYLAAVEAGTDPREAFERESGLTMATLTRALRAYFGDGRIPYRRLTRPSVAPPPVTVAVMPRSANNLLLYEAALRIGSSNAARGDLLERVRSAAARHDEDLYARRVLAQAEVLIGDLAAGDRLLDALLEASPNDAELLYLKGMRYLLAAEKGEDPAANARLAQRFFSRAHRINDSSYQTLFRYAQSLQGSADFVSENTTNILMLAHQLAPQVTAVRMNAAQMLIRRGEFDQAEALLRPLGSNPHNEELAQAAQRLIAQARARSREELPPQAADQPAADTESLSGEGPGTNRPLP